MTKKSEELRMQNGTTMNRCCCRFCGTVLQHTFVDLGMSPLCESYLQLDQLHQFVVLITEVKIYF